jgi:hypothetical protein
MKKRKLIIFDLDDTLIKSEAKIRVYDSTHNLEVTSLTPSQFNYHVKTQSHYFGFDDFECEKILGRSKFTKTFRSFRRYYKSGTPISIVTARSSDKIVLDFFKAKNYPLRPSLIFAIHNHTKNFTGSVAERKQQAIQVLIDKGYNDIIYYDDNLENLKMAEELSSDQVNIKIVHVCND